MAQKDVKEPAVEGEMETVAETQDSSGERRKGESFAEVRRKRKRKLRGAEMEVEGDERQTAAKRPAFPPIDASASLVCCVPNVEVGREREWGEVEWSQMIQK